MSLAAKTVFVELLTLAFLHPGVRLAILLLQPLHFDLATLVVTP